MLHHTRAAMRVALLVCILALSVSGCGPAWQPGNAGDGPDRSGPVRADDTALFAACVATCSENTSLALVTRPGCFDGCDQARRMVAFTGKEFSSRRECLDTLMQAEVRRQDSLTAMYRWCDAKWTHLHNRKGCYRATEAFFAALAPEPVCGSDVTESALYDIALAKAKEQAEAEPAPAMTEPAPMPAPAAPVPMAPPAVPASAPAPLPVTGEPAALPQGTAASAPQEGSAPAGDPRVVRTTQPAGPLVPPPYAPERPETLPAIHDTPKYQVAPAGKKSKATPEKKASPAPARVPTPAQQQPAAQRPVKPAQARPAQARSGPVVSGQITPGQTIPSQAASVPASPAQAGATPAPVAPAVPESPAPQAGAAPASERSMPEGQAAQAVPLPTPASPAPSAVPATPGPVQNSPGSQPAPESARRLDLPIPPQQPSGQQPSGPSVLMPPMSSMLNQPYDAPTIITPQVEPAPPGRR